MSIEVKVERREFFDYRKKEFIDDIIPTLTVKRAVRRHISAGQGSVLVGSHRVGPGSSFLMTYLGLATGTPLMYFVIRAHGTPYPSEVRGSVDFIYFESKGMETRIGNIKEPVHTFGPGTFKISSGSIGSASDLYCSFEGLEL